MKDKDKRELDVHTRPYPPKKPDTDDNDDKDNDDG